METEVSRWVSLLLGGIERIGACATMLVDHRLGAADRVRAAAEFRNSLARVNRALSRGVGEALFTKAGQAQLNRVTWAIREAEEFLLLPTCLRMAHSGSARFGSVDADVSIDLTTKFDSLDTSLNVAVKIINDVFPPGTTEAENDSMLAASVTGTDSQIEDCLRWLRRIDQEVRALCECVVEVESAAELDLDALSALLMHVVHSTGRLSDEFDAAPLAVVGAGVCANFTWQVSAFKDALRALNVAAMHRSRGEPSDWVAAVDQRWTILGWAEIASQSLLKILQAAQAERAPTEILLPARAGEGEPPKGKPARMSRAEANIRARQLAVADRKFLDKTQREWAKAIGCAVGQVGNLPLWILKMEKAGRAQASKGPGAVSLTPKVLQTHGLGEQDAVLEELIRQQEADKEPSPLDPDPIDGPSRKVRVNKRL